VVGDRIITHTGEIHEVVRVESKPSAKSLATVSFRGDPRPFVATEDHQVWALRDGVPKWIFAGDLTPEDFVGFSIPQETNPLVVAVDRPTRRPVRSASGIRGVYPYRRMKPDGSSYDKWVFRTKEGGRRGISHCRYFNTVEEAASYSEEYYSKLETEEIEITPDLAYLIGWYVAEGLLVRKEGAYRVGFSLHISEEWVCDELDQICEWYFGVTGTRRVLGNQIDYRVSSWQLYRLLDQLVGTGSKFKQLDSGLLKLPVDHQEQLMKGWISGDGHFDSSNGRTSLSSANLSLLRQGREILARLGTAAYLTVSTNPGGPTHRERSFVLGTLRFSNTARMLKISDNQIWHQVINVDISSHNGEVWDIEVEGDHSFRAYGVSVHNCSCPWFSYSFGRSGRWKKYEGRMCSHCLALMYQYQSSPAEVVKSDGWDDGPIDFYDKPPFNKNLVNAGLNGLSQQYLSTGKPTEEDITMLVENYGIMHGKDASPEQIQKLRDKKPWSWTASDADVEAEAMRLVEAKYATIDNDTIPLFSTANPLPGEALSREYATSPGVNDFYHDEMGVISRAYRDMPILERAAVGIWQQLGAIVVAQAEELKKSFDIQVLDYDPYNTAEEMHADIDRGVYKVTTLHSHHPVWDVNTNVCFRVVHDIIGHGRAGSDFSFWGEILAYRAQCDETPESLWGVLFTEIVAQSAYANVHHLFGEQKVGLIGFTPAQIEALVGKAEDAADPAYDALHFSASAEDWGFTWHPRTGESPSDGYMVSVQGHSHHVEIPGGRTSENEAKVHQALDAYVNDKADLFASNEKLHVGGWHDKDHNSFTLDPSEQIADRDEAIRLGRERNQQAIWDVANQEEIDTGGTGDRTAAWREAPLGLFKTAAAGYVQSNYMKMEQKWRDGDLDKATWDKYRHDYAISGDLSELFTAQVEDLYYDGFLSESQWDKYRAGNSLAGVSASWKEAPLGLFTADAPHDVSDEKRDSSGEWTTSPGSERIKPLEGDTVKSGHVALDLRMHSVPDKVRKQVIDRLTHSVGADPKTALHNIVEQFDRTPPEIRDEYVQWYKKTHDLSRRLGAANDVDPHIVAAIIAASSAGSSWSSKSGNKDVAQTIVEEASPANRKTPIDPKLRTWINERLGAPRFVKIPGKTEKRQLPPLTDWKVPEGASIQDVYDHIKDETPDTRHKILGMVVGKKYGFPVGYGYGNYGKAMYLALKNDPKEIETSLNGPKIRSFFNNIEDPDNHKDVTVDIHMWRAMVNDGGDRNATFKKYEKIDKNQSGITGSPSFQGIGVGAYPMAADILHMATGAINAKNGTNYSPAQVQAVVWGNQRTEWPVGEWRKDDHTLKAASIEDYDGDNATFPDADAPMRIAPYYGFEPLPEEEEFDVDDHKTASWFDAPAGLFAEAARPMEVEKFNVGDRVQIPVSGATGEIIRINQRNNGYRVSLDDEWLASKPPFFNKEIDVTPLNLKHALFAEAVQIDPKLVPAIQSVLTDDLRNKEYRGDENPMTGHCYVASEAAFHMLGGKEAGWKPVYWAGGRHWWLQNVDGTVLDITDSQFDSPVPREAGVGKGFLTSQPSKRAAEVISRVKDQFPDVSFTVTAAGVDTEPRASDGQWTKGASGIAEALSPGNKHAMDLLADITGSRYNDYSHGGCLIAAQAIQHVVGGTIKALIDYRSDRGQSDRQPMVQHYVVQTGPDTYLDARGEHTGREIRSDDDMGQFDASDSPGVFPDDVSGQLVDATPELIAGNRGIYSDPEAARRVADFIIQGKTATLSDTPEPALPSTDGAEDPDDEAYPQDLIDEAQGGSQSLAWLDPANDSGQSGGDYDIAQAARQYLAVKKFNFAEQQALINEGEDVLAANLGSLDIEGTHYEALEEAMAGADSRGENTLWW
jgi:hypothetical protein